MAAQRPKRPLREQLETVAGKTGFSLSPTLAGWGVFPYGETGRMGFGETIEDALADAATRVPAKPTKRQTPDEPEPPSTLT